MPVNRSVTIENAKLAFRNFSGKEGKFNPEGRRNFCVFLDPDVASVLKSDGWNIRWLEPRDPDDDKQAYIQVSVNYGTFPPKIVVITSKGKTIIQEDTISILDWAEIESADLIIRPYNWEVSGKKGVKAYVKSMYITLREDELELKYRDVPDSAMASIQDEDESPPF